MRKSATSRTSQYRKAFLPYLLVLPTLASAGLVLLYPTVRVIIMSFFRVDLLDPKRSGQFVGLQNYITILSKPDFWSSVGVTLLYTLGTLVGAYVVGILTALLLNRPLPGRGLARALVLVPWAVPFVVGVISWTWIFDTEYGVLNFVLLRLGLIATKVHWLTNTSVALGSLLMVTIWFQYPFVTMMMLAGFQSIPQELYDAASIDGAGPWRRFWSVTMPGLRSVHTVVIVLVTVWTFKLFTIPYTLTGGGPAQATETLVVQTYRQAFTFYNMGLAATVGTITLAIIGLLTTAYFLILARRGDAV